MGDGSSPSHIGRAGVLNGFRVALERDCTYCGRHFEGEERWMGGEGDDVDVAPKLQTLDEAPS